MPASRTPLVVALGAVTAACAIFAVVAGITSTDDDDNAVSAAPPAADGAATQTVDVDIADFNFDPREVQVTVGGTVTWTNRDGFAHSVRATDQSFGSDPLDQGATYQFTFPAAGSYAYICGIHPSMTGTVVVR